MKTVIKTILIIFFTNCTFAQLPVLTTSSLANPADDIKLVQTGNYAIDINNERNQYLGLWEYNMNGVLFQLKIEKVDKFLVSSILPGQANGNYYFTDNVAFKYKLVKNGITIYDNLNQNISSNFSSATKRASEPHLRGRFIEYHRNVNIYCEITKLNTVPEKIYFKLSRFDYNRKNPHSFYQNGLPLFYVPMNGIEMTKI